MKAKKAVKIDRTADFTGRRNRNVSPQIVILAFTVGHYHIQPIDRSALENSYQNLLFAVAVFNIGRVCKLVQKFRSRCHKAKARQSDSACFYKKSSVHLIPLHNVTLASRDSSRAAPLLSTLY